MGDDPLPHRGQAVSQFGILVRRQVHVIDQEKTSWSEGGDRLAELEDLPSGGIGEDQVKRSDRSDEIGPVPPRRSRPSLASRHFSLHLRAQGRVRRSLRQRRLGIRCRGQSKTNPLRILYRFPGSFPRWGRHWPGRPSVGPPLPLRRVRSRTCSLDPALQRQIRECPRTRPYPCCVGPSTLSVPHPTGVLGYLAAARL